MKQDVEVNYIQSASTPQETVKAGVDDVKM